MTQNEKFRMAGVWNVVVKNKYGEITSEEEYENLLPLTGRKAMASGWAGNNAQTAKGTYIAVGTNTTAPADGDVQLGTELARKAITLEDKPLRWSLGEWS